MKNDKVIYTVISNDGDPLTEPAYITPGWDYYCFTNNKTLQSKTWEIIPMEASAEPPEISSHRPKILFYEYVKARHNLAIYIDPHILIQSDLNEFVNKALLNGDSMGVLQHPDHNCLYKEAAAIKQKADPKGIDQQIQRYRNEGFPENNGLASSNLLIYRNHNFSLLKHCAYWWEEFSNTNNVPFDELSYYFVRWKHNIIQISTYPYETLNNKEFKWVSSK